MKTFAVRLIALVVFGLLAPASAWAQAQWGEPINIPGERFIVLESYNNQAVYDKETGLVWEQSPISPLVQVQTWLNAQIQCNSTTAGNRLGWRLPTLQELASLIDRTAPTRPKLPPGHPFSTVGETSYWSATTDASNASSAWHVDFEFGVVGRAGKVFSRPVWCVRGGQGVNPQ